MKKTSAAVRIMFVVMILAGMSGQQTFPCSTFVLQNRQHMVFGGNLDFYSSKGLVVINKRGLSKTALLSPSEKPVSWISRHGSITFNQMGREFPFGGMNEQGLVIQMMWLDETEYPPPDERPGIGALQWIQYQLDNSATVEQVIASDSVLRISSPGSSSNLHYLVCDRGGNAAAVEFLDGRLVCHTGRNLPVAALTNATYDACLIFSTALDSLSANKQALPTSYSSSDRFVRIAGAQRKFETGNDKPAVDYAFDVLESVSAPKRGNHCTAWSIVYDVNTMRLYFKTFENRKTRFIEFNDFDFACTTAVLALEMDRELSGDVSDEFVPYTLEMNSEMVTSVIAAYKESGFLTDISDVAIQFLVHYPEYLICE